MALRYLPFGWIIIIQLCKGQTLPEGAPERKTECRGTSLIGSCPSNHSLAVKGVQYGTKLTSTCGLSNTSAGCCDYDDADCFITYNGTAQQDACSGRDLCISISVAAADTSSCGNSSYPILNHYLAMEYYCVADSRMSALCDSVPLSETNSALYLTNLDYPSAIRKTETSCSCSVETTNCSSKINVYFVHFQLTDGSGSCTGNQKIEINDKGTIHTFTCHNNTGFSITQTLTISSNYLQIALDNQNGIGEGTFWVGFEATENTSELNIQCPAAEQLICKDCPALTEPINGSLSSDLVTVGSSVTVSCISGHTLFGDETLECLTNGSWTAPVGTCRKDCPTLTAPTNGFLSTIAVIVGTTVNVNCSSTYTLTGAETLECQSGGTWNASVGTCEKDCPTLTAPTDGSISTYNVTSGTTVTVSCNPSFTLFGNEILECQPGGRWTAAVGTCGKGLGDSCTTVNDCSSVTQAICKNLICVCAEGYTESNKSCVSTGTGGNGLGDSCTSLNDCSSVTQAICKDSVCVCAEGYTEDNKSCVSTGTGGNGSTDLTTGAVIGIVIGVILTLCIIGVVLLVLCIYNNRYKRIVDRIRKRISSSTTKIVPRTDNDKNLQNGEIVTSTSDTSKQNGLFGVSNQLTEQNVPPTHHTLKREEDYHINSVDTQEELKPDLQSNGVFRKPDFLHFDLSQIRVPTPASPAQLYLSERSFTDSLFADSPK